MSPGILLAEKNAIQNRSGLQRTRLPPRIRAAPSHGYHITLCGGCLVLIWVSLAPLRASFPPLENEGLAEPSARPRGSVSYALRSTSGSSPEPRWVDEAVLHPARSFCLHQGGPLSPSFPRGKHCQEPAEQEASLGRQANILESQALDPNFNVRRRGCRGVSPGLRRICGNELWPRLACLPRLFTLGLWPGVVRARGKD